MDYCVSSKPSYRQSLVTEYKAFIRPHLDYGDIIYNQTYNDPFHQKMESVLHNAALAITGALRGKLYQELGLESFCKRWWYRKLCYFFKIFKGQSPEYLRRILSSVSSPTNTPRGLHVETTWNPRGVFVGYITRTNDTSPLFSGKDHYFRNSFFFHQLLRNGIT